MFRTVLVVALAAVAAAHNHGHGHGHGLGQIIVRPNPYGAVLGGLLSPSHYSAAIQLVQRRYSSLPGLPAAYIIRYILSQQQLPIYSQIKYHSIPALSGRLVFLRAVFGALPSPFYQGSYLSGLRSYLGRYKYPHWGGVIVPLALLDIRLAAQQYRPVSVSSFNTFFSTRVLGFHGHHFGAIPAVGSLHSTFNRLSLPAYPAVFQSIRASIATPTYTGASLLPVLSGIGLPRFYQPQASLGGLSAYLRHAGIVQRNFIRQISRITRNTIRRLIHPFVKQYSGAIRSDLLSLAAVRYLTLPQAIRSRLSFQSVFPSYYRAHVKASPRRLSSSYVSSYLSGFSRHVFRRHPKYSGKRWW
ncbi:uncharacterized protein LOC119095856 [Pollicipes pollicipes]|uniref:uncharacterized protein LOC119095856 n=1 Tax=Pollicipes pollicipes TaxID=41117 RepID=UPI001885695E|nr:uncharacterized protein LOC119095856 [Pollicipes pollicipes]